MYNFNHADEQDGVSKPHRTLLGNIYTHIFRAGYVLNSSKQFLIIGYECIRLLAMKVWPKTDNCCLAEHADRCDNTDKVLTN